MAYSGKYYPHNPKKYKGNLKKIVWRSSWELKMMKHLDFADKVIQWNSEEIVIPYFFPLDQKNHRYFMDFWVRYKSSKGTKEMIIEVKPQKERVAPKKQRKKTKRYLTEVETYIKNRSKWDAAEKWAKQHKMEFKIFSEKELGIK